MRGPLRTAAVGVAVGMLLAASGALSAAAAPPGASGAGWRAAAIDWQPCADAPNDEGVRCGTLRVPVDWSRPDGPTFGLAVAKRAATDPSEDRGPLVINPGGPGGSGVDAAISAGQYFSPELRKHFDIIGFDPRGVARSHPVVCSAELLRGYPEPTPTDRAGYRAMLAYHAKLAADCRKRTGPLFDHVDTESVVQDIDAIRHSLGVERISYYGVSYGTLIGQEYAERYPHRVRAMVIDSNMDHSLGTAGFLATETATDEDSFREFAAWCDRDTSCALHGRDVGAVYDGLMRRADAGTLTGPGNGQPITAYELSSAAVSAFYGPDWAGLAEVLSTLDAEPTVRPHTDGDVGQYPMAVFCEDWSLPVHGYREFQRLAAASHRLAPHLRYSTIGWSSVTSCLGFSAPVNNPQHRLRVHTDIPLLVINARHDPATPYAWGAHDAAMLGRHARFVTYDGWGHGTYGRSDCTTGYQDDYLIDRTLPPAGASCAAVEPPDAGARSAPAPDGVTPGW